MKPLNVMVRMLSRGKADTRATANLFCMIGKARPKWNVAIHNNHLGVCVARNECVAEAEQDSSDYLIMIDDDVIPNEKILELPDHGVDIVAGLVPIWKEGRFFWNAFDLVDDRLVPITGWTPGQLRECYAIGGGILCISKQLIQFKSAYPLFQWHILPSGVLAQRGGEDIWFCKKMKAWNYKIYVDPDCQGEHHTTIPLLHTMNQMQKDKNGYIRTFCKVDDGSNGKANLAGTADGFNLRDAQIGNLVAGQDF